MMASRGNKYALATFLGLVRLELSMFLPDIKKICEAQGRELNFEFDKNKLMINILSTLPVIASCVSKRENECQSNTKAKVELQLLV